MKMTTLLTLAATFSTTVHAANISMPKPVLPPLQTMKFGGPVPSPTRPEEGKNTNETYKKLQIDEASASSTFTPTDIATYDSVSMTITDDGGNTYSFIQFKQLDETYTVFVPQSLYKKMNAEGVELNSDHVKVLSDKEYIILSKQVQLKTFGHLSFNDYIGGEGGRCAAGTIGAAIGGAIAGGAVAGPAGAVAGAVGGALYGSTSACR